MLAYSYLQVHFKYIYTHTHTHTHTQKKDFPFLFFKVNFNKWGETDKFGFIHHNSSLVNKSKACVTSRKNLKQQLGQFDLEIPHYEQWHKELISFSLMIYSLPKGTFEYCIYMFVNYQSQIKVTKYFPNLFSQFSQSIFPIYTPEEQICFLLRFRMP